MAHRCVGEPAGRRRPRRRNRTRSDRRRARVGRCLGVDAAVHGRLDARLVRRGLAGEPAPAHEPGLPAREPRQQVPQQGRRRDRLGGSGGARRGRRLGRIPRRAVLLAGMSIAAWPPVDPGQLERVGAGTGSAIDWVAAAFPVVARIVVASILGVLAGAAWSTLGGPAARMEALEGDVDQELDDLSVVDAPGPDAPRPDAPAPGAPPR